PRPVFEPALEPLQEDTALHGLQPRPDADLTKLRDHAFAAGIERRDRRHPLHVETVREPRLAHQLLRSLAGARELRPLDRVLHAVVDPVARGLAQPPRLRLVDGPPVDGQAHRFASPLVVKRILGVLESGELEPPGSGEHRREHDTWKLSDLVDELARDEIDDIGLTALQHRDTGGRLWHRDHHQLLHVHRTVVAVEGLQLELHARLVADEPVGAGSDWLLLEGVRTHLLVVLLRYYPAWPRDIRGPEENCEVEKRLFEEEADRSVVHDLDTLRLLLENVGLGSPVVLVAELDVLRSDRLAVLELDPLP